MNSKKDSMRELKESATQKSIIDFLKLKRFVVFKHRNVGIYKKNTGKYIPLADGELGISDIIACSPKGIFWAIEVKKRGKTPSKDGKPSTEQLEFIEKIKANGGVALVAYSLDDVTKLFTIGF